MLYQQGYQNYYSPESDIGLFTFYRQQAEYESARKNNKHQASLKRQKKQLKSNQIKTQRKESRRFSTLDNQRKASNITMQKQRKITNVKSSNQEVLTTKQQVEQYMRNRNEKQQKMFTNRKHISLHKKRNKNHYNCPQDEKSSQYFSPRSRIFNFDQKPTQKNIYSQDIECQKTLEPRISMNYLPKIQHQPIIRYRNNKNFIENCTIDEENGLRYYRLYQNINAIKKRNKKGAFDESKECQKDKNKEVGGTFVMISSRQYQMMAEKKDVPLISILKKYSRNN